jgi:hypothetical protein
MGCPIFYPITSCTTLCRTAMWCGWSLTDHWNNTINLTNKFIRCAAQYVSSQPMVCITIRLHAPGLAIHGCVFIYAGYEVAFMYSIHGYKFVVVSLILPTITTTGHVMTTCAVHSITRSLLSY